MYDYREATREAVKQAIRDNFSDNSIIYHLATREAREAFEEELNETLWTDDAVTGNGSGSYTFSREEAGENLKGNAELVREMCIDYCIDAGTIVDKFLAADWEYFDVSARCYVLGEAIAEALDEIGNNIIMFGTPFAC